MRHHPQIHLVPLSNAHQSKVLIRYPLSTIRDLFLVLHNPVVTQ